MGDQVILFPKHTHDAENYSTCASKITKPGWFFITITKPGWFLYHYISGDCKSKQHELSPHTSNNDPYQEVQKQSALTRIQ